MRRTHEITIRWGDLQQQTAHVLTLQVGPELAKGGGSSSIAICMRFSSIAMKGWKPLVSCRSVTTHDRKRRHADAHTTVTSHRWNTVQQATVVDDRSRRPTASRAHVSCLWLWTPGRCIRLEASPGLGP